MKSLKIKLAAIAIFLIVGSIGASAQICTGTCLFTEDCITLQIADGSCLTEDQQAILDDLYDVFQAEMDILRTELQTATTFDEKVAIRAEMVDLREVYLATVQALLDEWGIK